MRLFNYPMAAVRNVHYYWAQSATADKKAIAEFFRQFVNEGESVSIRPISPPQFSTLSDGWNLVKDNPRAAWWKGRCGRFFVIAPFVCEGLELVGGGMAAIEIGAQPETLYDISFDAAGVIVNPPGAERRFALRDFSNFDAPNFDVGTLRFWAPGMDECVLLSTDREYVCIYAPVSRKDCEDAIFFTLEARGGGEQSPK